MHIGIIVAVIDFLTRTIKQARPRKYIKNIVLILYWLILEFSPSSSRAIIMAIFSITAELLFKKAQNNISISLSALILLIINPLYLVETSFILSYGATIAIIYIYPIINKKVIIKTNSKILNYIKESYLIIISVYLILIPIVTILFKKIPISFLLTSLLITPITFIIIIFGIVFLIIPSFFSFLTIPIINFLTILFIKIGSINLGTFNTISFSLVGIIIYYSFLLSKALKQKILKTLFRKILITALIIEILLGMYFNVLKTYNEIYLIDVGQGDSLLIITKSNKKIIIDGGGNEEYNIGKNVLVPYLLSKRIYTIDYAIISHFDTDHCQRHNRINRKSKSKKYDYWNSTCHNTKFKRINKNRRKKEY